MEKNNSLRAEKAESTKHKRHFRDLKTAQPY